ncbi:hypothetical protein ACX0G7_09705 [Flavitalea antarctica]
MNSRFAFFIGGPLHGAEILVHLNVYEVLERPPLPEFDPANPERVDRVEYEFYKYQCIPEDRNTFVLTER